MAKVASYLDMKVLTFAKDKNMTIASIIIGKVFTKKLAGVVKKRTIAMIKALCKHRMYCSATSQLVTK